MELNMRTLERYLNRRNITDAKLYFINKGIETDERLNEWCGNNNVEPPGNSIFDPIAEEESQYSTKDVKSVIVAKPTEEEETWHVPAAERPLRKPKPVKKSASRAKRKVTK